MLPLEGESHDVTYPSPGYVVFLITYLHILTLKQFYDFLDLKYLSNSGGPPEGSRLRLSILHVRAQRVRAQ